MAAEVFVLSIDDDPMQHIWISAALQTDYGVLTANSGIEGLQMLGKLAPLPSVILMDIRMPGMDGFEACRHIKAEDSTRDVPVLFVSVEQGLEDRLRAYDAGGSDFISKPPQAEELRAKVALAIQQAEEREALRASARDAFDTAMTAMSSASELGVVIQALRKGFSANTIQELAAVVLDACTDYGLDGCVRLEGSGHIYGASQSGNLTPVEQSILEHLSKGDRIFTMGRQAAFHYGGATLLIRNMPLQERDRAERLRDHLAILAEGCEARLLAILSQVALEDREKKARRLFELSIAALEDIHARHVTHGVETENTLHLMLSELEALFPGLGLTVAQEQAVMKLIEGATHLIVQRFKQGLSIEAHLSEIREAMQGA